MKTIWVEDDQHKRIKLESVKRDKQMSEIFTEMFDNYFVKEMSTEEKHAPDND